MQFCWLQVSVLLHGHFHQSSFIIFLIWTLCLSSECLLFKSGTNRSFCLSRYLKRGVNENGRVANDVETEQILFEDVPEDFPVQISSVVQNRGSIPLFWFQETSRLNLKPDIICMFMLVHVTFVRI